MSNPCLNGGTCFPSSSKNPTKRYRCSCTIGYTGTRCQEQIRSCRGYKSENNGSGTYKIFDNKWKLFEVFCDFDSNSTIAWTLIQSFKLEFSDMFKNSFFIDHPVNEESPIWHKYRLSKSRMLSIQRDSKKWRQTCNYNEKYQAYVHDYVLCSNKIDILDYNTRMCVEVKKISAIGFPCSNYTAMLRENYDRSYHHCPLHFTIYLCDSKKTYRRYCRDYFEYYKCRTSFHHCSLDVFSTTQTWFGG